jgi:hypothetical protein
MRFLLNLTAGAVLIGGGLTGSFMVAGVNGGGVLLLSGLATIGLSVLALTRQRI